MKFNKWMTLVPAIAVLFFIGGDAFAAEVVDNNKGMTAMAAALCMGLAAFGGALGQGMAARAAFESIGRNPQAADKLNTPFILGLALIESLVIYGLVIAFFLQGKVEF